MLASKRWRNWRPSREAERSSDPGVPEVTKMGFATFGTSNVLSSQENVRRHVGTPHTKADNDRLGAKLADRSAFDPEPQAEDEEDFWCPVMPLGLKLLQWEPKDAPVKLSRFQTVLHVRPFIDSTLRQVEARLSGKVWLAGNWTLSTLIDRLASCGCLVELTNPKVALH
jgi:hypothetical protein